MADADFRARWVEELNRQAKLLRRSRARNQNLGWEATRAYRELAERDSLWLVQPNADTNDWPFERLVSKSMREIESYRRFKAEIIPTNRCFRDAFEALRGAATRLGRAHTESAPVKTAVDAALRKCASQLERTRRALQDHRESYWESEPSARSQERQAWPVYFDEKGQVHSIPPEDLAEWERTFSRFNYPKDLHRRIDLDSRFQVRVGAILRAFFIRASGVSLRTISRLIVLTYKCADLALHTGDIRVDYQYLVIAGTQRKLTVSAVDQKIRGAGLR